jgi:hypothetical protein
MLTFILFSIVSWVLERLMTLSLTDLTMPLNARSNQLPKRLATKTQDLLGQSFSLSDLKDCEGFGRDEPLSQAQLAAVLMGRTSKFAITFAS